MDSQSEHDWRNILHCAHCAYCRDIRARNLQQSSVEAYQKGREDALEIGQPSSPPTRSPSRTPSRPQRPRQSVTIQVPGLDHPIAPSDSLPLPSLSRPLPRPLPRTHPHAFHPYLRPRRRPSNPPVLLTHPRPYIPPLYPRKLFPVSEISGLTRRSRKRRFHQVLQPTVAKNSDSLAALANLPAANSAPPSQTPAPRVR
ncbi:hypothetical protein GGS26DRAFT_49256 [Hypomontagnella submonticulosa]|nr:hypothetical protein GGS26DRAFT_49256 [Hypomontagnella submonticulosa]